MSVGRRYLCSHFGLFPGHFEVPARWAEQTSQPGSWLCPDGPDVSYILCCVDSACLLQSYPYVRQNMELFLFNSRTAIAGAIIGLLLVFFTIQRIWIVLGRCLFYDSKRSIGEVLFLNQFYWSEFWSGKWNTWKNLEWFWCWTKVKSGAKRVVFVHIAVFWRARHWGVKKIL